MLYEGRTGSWIIITMITSTTYPTKTSNRPILQIRHQAASVAASIQLLCMPAIIDKQTGGFPDAVSVLSLMPYQSLL